MAGQVTVADLLAFEREWLNAPDGGRKSAAIRLRFGCSDIRHAQRLAAALRTREAWASDAVTCRVLTERMRLRQQGRRSA